MADCNRMPSDTSWQQPSVCVTDNEVTGGTKTQTESILKKITTTEC